MLATLCLISCHYHRIFFADEIDLFKIIIRYFSRALFSIKLDHESRVLKRKDIKILFTKNIGLSDIAKPQVTTGFRMRARAPELAELWILLGRFSAAADQGCQVVCFQTKIPIWVNFGGSCNGKCWYIL
jgi:hypothetical protein